MRERVAETVSCNISAGTSLQKSENSAEPRTPGRTYAIAGASEQLIQIVCVKFLLFGLIFADSQRSQRVCTV